MSSQKCFHNYPYVDENPIYYDLVKEDNPYFDGCNEFKCRHCGKLYHCDGFTQEGQTFYNNWTKLTNKSNN
jgi:hypothetical protein